MGPTNYKRIDTGGLLLNLSSYIPHQTANDLTLYKVIPNRLPATNPAA